MKVGVDRGSLGFVPKFCSLSEPYQTFADAEIDDRIIPRASPGGLHLNSGSRLELSAQAVPAKGLPNACGRGRFWLPPWGYAIEGGVDLVRLGLTQKSRSRSELSAQAVPAKGLPDDRITPLAFPWGLQLNVGGSWWLRIRSESALLLRVARTSGACERFAKRSRTVGSTHYHAPGFPMGVFN